MRNKDHGAMSGPLRNTKHEAFVQRIALLEDAGPAYAKVYRVKKPEVAATNGGRLLRNADVTARLGELQAQNEAKSGISREQLLKMLVDTFLAKPSDASMDNPLCELKMSKAGPYAAFMDKSKVAERLAKMMGWDEPDRIEHSGEIKLNVMTEERRAELIRKKREAIEARAASRN